MFSEILNEMDITVAFQNNPSHILNTLFLSRAVPVHMHNTETDAELEH